MRISRSRYGDLNVLTVSEVIDDTDTAELRTELVAAVERAAGDVVMDVGQVVSVTDAALDALVTARSRAKHARHRVVMVDRPDGSVTLSLRRTGLAYRFPVYPDLAAADQGLAADRSARRRLTLNAPEAVSA